VIIRKGVPVGEAQTGQTGPAENSHRPESDFESTVIIRPGGSAPAPASERESQANADYGGPKPVDDDAVVDDLDSTIIINPRKKP